MAFPTPLYYFVTYWAHYNYFTQCRDARPTMTTPRIYAHADCTGHEPGAGHPESPARIDAVLAALPADAILAPPLADRGVLAGAHDPAYVDAVFEAAPSSGRVYLDPDTAMSTGSLAAARRAAGAVVAAVDAVAAGDTDSAFCAVRPPGHHAESARAMGFCLFNSVAVAAHHARAAHGMTRVAVVDFDVHHGNGTQAMFWHDPDLMYASTHQYPFYPGTGAASESGVAGNIVNQPLGHGAGSAAFRAAMTGAILPALREFAPELLIISAGFDAHAADPLGGLDLTTGDFAWVTAELCAAAADVCDGRVVSALEGGYDLAALTDATAAHVAALSGERR